MCDHFDSSFEDAATSVCGPLNKIIYIGSGISGPASHMNAKAEHISFQIKGVREQLDDKSHVETDDYYFNTSNVHYKTPEGLVNGIYYGWIDSQPSENKVYIQPFGKTSKLVFSLHFFITSVVVCTNFSVL
jgi:hypothetical protein